MNQLLTKLSHGQNRAILLTGKRGWGKFTEGLEFARHILNEDPIHSSDFFCFRNDLFTLKTEYFFKKMPDSPQAWQWLSLLQRRINMSKLIDESLSGVKLASTKETLDEYISQHSFPQDEKFIKQLLDLTEAFDKKSGIPISVVREAIKFHSVQSSKGRVSIIADIDTADETTQNSALKLLEEPFPNHWLLLTAEYEKNIIPTILSRTVKIAITQPIYTDISFLGNEVFPLSTTGIMEEELYHVSSLKKSLLADFFTQCVNQVDQNINFLQFAEKLTKDHHALMFVNELLYCFEDALILRQSALRHISLPLKFPNYHEFSTLLQRASVAEMEEHVEELIFIKQQIIRSVIKADAMIVPAFLSIARTLLRTT